MKILLCLILVIVGEAAYYEYTTERRITSGCDHQLSDWQGKINTLQAENQKLSDEKIELAKDITHAQVETRRLTAEFQRAQMDAANRAQNPAPTESIPSQSAIPSVNLGTITTLLGQTFQNCKLLKIEADGITFSHSEGITKVLYAYLRPEMQKRFGYDPQKAAAQTEANLLYQQQMRDADAQRAQTPPAGSAPSP